MTVKYNTVKLMDIDFINISRYSFLKKIVYPSIEQEKKCFIVTANPEVVIATRDDPDFKTTVKSADYVLADGVGVVNASKLINNPIKERVTGVDIMYDLLQYASDNKKKVFFLGASEEVNMKVMDIVKKDYPGLIIAGRKNGYFNKYDDRIAEQIAATKPDIVFVALGAKRQEGWIHHYMDKFDKGIFIGIGGSFDVLSGQIKRAPEIWIKLQLEWLYRLLKEPHRMRRDLKVLEFMLLHVPVIKRIMKWLGFSKSKPRSSRDGIR
ncbi:acetylglucosaminyldiphosphoundecaprenol acetyl-beta-D-mannosaminyltransferase [Jeotgalicoccus coquinae]|uniref:N-acetylglucosaminyldiphosphoundecaprenol N-acetyl-beta-D-mannosaminyltransferase n=1 Tax=Jeotgalicoccus coquinae TaxID=709509 RepID=A0A6V7RM10_9STAP|nr:WecB/TagA/CpsF family glycosyltransferase [Jeotgalicoccus coquinae]MBB6422458.1 N-acetylglucosaminyldiphosphoundecaprenol N-acetyl-beta-D-mannosaminyltransferase [Jeotgalicoccus coquinae]GGE15710.1 acetylglucosaminyldiphosphoundecaprenol acetyl-beta-D-mannosaminyltransferase [Jeotgalicoccus coquinae]CAD2078561.1 Putative N-acetylmannosaminyltransferase [Jeotgalicoccus coquinae]